MTKYEYQMLLWQFGSLGKGLRLIAPNGSEIKYKIEGMTNIGEKDFIVLLNKFGSEGWELFNVVSIDHGAGGFTRQAFLKRAVNN